MPNCQWCGDSFGHRPECPELEVNTLRARVAELEREVEVLRAWGNKDTLSIADEELAQRRAHPVTRQETHAERLANLEDLTPYRDTDFPCGY